MDSYAMTKFGLESKDMLNSRQKNCGFYLKYFFLFTSLIQFLIILGLVLFMVYGNAHGATKSQLELMEKRATELHKTISHLRAENDNLSRKLNLTTGERNRYFALYQSTQRELVNCSQSVHICQLQIIQLNRLLQQCTAAMMELKHCNNNLSTMNVTCYVEKFRIKEERNHLELEFHKFRKNCSETTADLTQKMRAADSDREFYRLQMIDLRNERNDLKTQLEKFQGSCASVEKKFSEELQNLRQTITSAVERALPLDSSRLDIFKLKESYSQLSELVLNKVNEQLKSLEDQISSKLMENSFLHAKNLRSEEKLRECEKTRTTMAQEHQRALEAIRKSWDAEVKRIYEEKQKLTKEKESLAQELEEKSQTLGTVRAQLGAKVNELDRCQRFRVPCNPNPRNPGSVPSSGGSFEELSKQLQNLGRPQQGVPPV
ncbi:plasmalemma vesicle-associated protein [Rhinatrema bivittatum]|uniref:plasmalemma vesicle-associated protein n=1 Tax=Rhinatrema bivittatum TaxID=194408 RepID=UPI001125EED9|nr:plasmalemma vesicle-associated protein [Rhinatrema bivittatum]XP_029469664.1 plasmalemma vesicle-associated protein [Rhinatrema bivittatum]